MLNKLLARDEKKEAHTVERLLFREAQLKTIGCNEFLASAEATNGLREFSNAANIMGYMRLVIVNKWRTTNRPELTLQTLMKVAKPAVEASKGLELYQPLLLVLS
ncbi:hypothetical protein ACH5RR_012919 [Cinchona calisaya]|uniref:Uncharacterized protein n=1 Tax=Cinchona calisaya TaxID=153742 RepID=A0ABD3AAQ9_9GENT